MSHAAWDPGLEALGDGPFLRGFYTKSPKMVMNLYEFQVPGSFMILFCSIWFLMFFLLFVFIFSGRDPGGININFL